MPMVIDKKLLFVYIVMLVAAQVTLAVLSQDEIHRKSYAAGLLKQQTI